MYFGYAEKLRFSYDIGYLYYNYDANAGYDFGEVYGSVSVGNFTAKLSLLSNAEPDEGPGEDFGFAQASYTSRLRDSAGKCAEIGLHAGFHEGDFMYSFNGATDDYWDFNISIAKDGFSAMISTTTLGDDDDGDGIEDYASMAARDNDSVKFVVGYALDFELNYQNGRLHRPTQRDKSMKLITTIIKPFKLDDVREALSELASRARLSLR